MDLTTSIKNKSKMLRVFSKNPAEPIEKKSCNRSSRSNKNNSTGLLKTKFSLLNTMQTLGYRLGKRIGEGSYSKVYCAEHKPIPGKIKPFSNKPIACKIIDQRYTSNEYNLKFLPRELSIVHHLMHPHIIQTHAILECGPYICFFMEFCPHGDLLDFIQKTGPLSDTLAKLYFKQIISAINYLHKNDICHRDIKCENVLIHNLHLVKLSDFGFSKKCDKYGHQFMSKTFCGSSAYAAPQVLRGIPYDPKAYDMWSLGCLLYIMATGTMPYDDKNIALTIQKQEKHIVNYPSKIKVNNQIDNLIRQLLDPIEKRRPTIDKLLKDHPWLN